MIQKTNRISTRQYTNAATDTDHAGHRTNLHPLSKLITIKGGFGGANIFVLDFSIAANATKNMAEKTIKNNARIEGTNMAQVPLAQRIHFGRFQFA